MRNLRTLAVAATSAILVMGQAVAAFACEQHQADVSVTDPARSATAGTTTSRSPRRPAIRSWPTLPESPASPSRRWVRWECATSRAI